MHPTEDQHLTRFTAHTNRVPVSVPSRFPSRTNECRRRGFVRSHRIARRDWASSTRLFVRSQGRRRETRQSRGGRGGGWRVCGPGGLSPVNQNSFASSGAESVSSKGGFARIASPRMCLDITASSPKKCQRNVLIKPRRSSGVRSASGGMNIWINGPSSSSKRRNRVLETSTR
jgi:hypothetical protein